MMIHWQFHPIPASLTGHVQRLAGNIKSNLAAMHKEGLRKPHIPPIMRLNPQQWMDLSEGLEMKSSGSDKKTQGRSE